MSLLFSCPLNYPQTWFHTILTSKSRNRAVVKVKSGNPLSLKLKTSRKPRRTHHSIFIPQGKTPGRTKKWFLNCLWKYIKSMWVKFHCVSFIFEGSPPRRDCPRGHTLSFKWGWKGKRPSAEPTDLWRVWKPCRGIYQTCHRPARENTNFASR